MSKKWMENVVEVATAFPKTLERLKASTFSKDIKYFEFALDEEVSNDPLVVQLRYKNGLKSFAFVEFRDRKCYFSYY